MSEKDSGRPKDTQSWLEFAQKIDPRDHKKAAASLGTLLVLGVGLGGYVLSKKHGAKKVSIVYGDRHLQDEKVVSMVDSSRDGKFAIGVPQDEGEHAGEFSMDVNEAGELEIVRPHGEHNETHESRIRKATEWAVDLLKQRLGSKE